MSWALAGLFLMISAATTRMFFASEHGLRFADMTAIQGAAHLGSAVQSLLCCVLVIQTMTIGWIAIETAVLLACLACGMWVTAPLEDFAAAEGKRRS